MQVAWDSMSRGVLCYALHLLNGSGQDSRSPIKREDQRGTCNLACLMSLSRPLAYGQVIVPGRDARVSEMAHHVVNTSGGTAPFGLTVA